MAEGARQKAARRASQTATPDEYNTFIQQVDLESVWLASAHIDNKIGSEPPDRAEASIDRVSSWGAVKDGFIALDTYKIVLGATRDPAATIDVTFGLTYRSQIPMTEGLFELFRTVNLPLNAWPYAREFVANATARMNWIPFTLPALRFGAPGRADHEDSTTEPARKRPRSRTRTVVKGDREK